MDVEATRANYEKLTKELEDMYQQNPDDTAISLAYAKNLLQMGELTNAQTTTGKCIVCYRCMNKCPKQAITILGKQIYEQCRIDHYIDDCKFSDPTIK